MTLIIRPFRAEDAEATAAIAEGSGLNPPAVHRTPVLPVVVQLVASVDERVVGYLAGDLELAPDPATGEIVPVMPLKGYATDMAVHPSYRRRGIGRRLIEQALAEYRAAGCAGMALCTSSDASCYKCLFVDPGVFGWPDPACHLPRRDDGGLRHVRARSGRRAGAGRLLHLRLMIDRAFQSRGFGRAALQVTLRRLRAEPGCREILIRVHPENTIAVRLYGSLGFTDSGLRWGEERVYSLRLTSRE